MKQRIAALCLAVCLLLCGCRSLLPDTQTAADFPAEEESISIQLAGRSTQELFFLPYAPDLGTNPYTTQSRSNLTFLPLVYEGLFTVTPEFTAECSLCESYTTNDRGDEYTLTLRAGVRFHSGTMLTAADVAASINHARSTDAYRQRLSCIRSVEVSENSLVIRLDQPRDQFPLLLDIPIVRAGTEDLDLPDGTGPYSLVLNGSGENYLDSFSDWWGEGEKPISRIYLLDCGTAAQVRDSLEYGRISLACTDPNGAAAVPYHSDCEQWSMATTEMLYLGFNRSDGLFSDPAVRRAVTYAINRETISVDIGQGYITPVSIPANPSSPVYNASLNARYDRDLSQSRQLLEEAGLSDKDRDGVLEIETEEGRVPAAATLLVCSAVSSDVRAAQSIADDLSQLGLDITVLSLETEEYESRRSGRVYDFFYESVRLSPDLDLDCLLRTLGLMDTLTDTLCTLAAENLGNYYDLHDHLIGEGSLCVIGFKSCAVYALRGHAEGLNPAPYNVFYHLTGLELMAENN